VVVEQEGELLGWRRVEVPPFVGEEGGVSRQFVCIRSTDISVLGDGVAVVLLVLVVSGCDS
jgi:hypothetical protein